MATGDEFFEHDIEHGYVKRFMYMRHLQAFVAKTQQGQHRTIINDLFAGAGRYGPTLPSSIEDWGSPIIALHVAVQYIIRAQNLPNTFQPREVVEQQNVPIRKVDIEVRMPEQESNIILNFSEANQSNCNDLVNNICSVLTSYGIHFQTNVNENDVIEITSQDEEFSLSCNVCCAEFINIFPHGNLLNSRYMTFIDPYGYSQIPLHHVQNFVGPNNEILINFMSSYVNRFGRREVNEGNIRALFGFNNAVDIRQLLFDDENPINKCLDEYEKALKVLSGSDYVLTFEVRSKTNSPLYHLIFVTNHIKGLEAMKEAMNRGTQCATKLSMSDYMVIRRGIPLSLGNDQDENLVANTIFLKFKGCSDVPVQRIKMYVTLETPFVFRKKPLKILLKQPNPKITRVVDEHGQSPRRYGTFPDNTEYFLTFRSIEPFEFIQTEHIY